MAITGSHSLLGLFQFSSTSDKENNDPYLYEYCYNVDRGHHLPVLFYAKITLLTFSYLFPAVVFQVLAGIDNVWRAQDAMLCAAQA
jgi:hypothetical protein